MTDLKNLDTEKRNQNTKNIDIMDTDGILKLINQEDAIVSSAVKAELPNIAKAVDIITESLRAGGRLIYIGAGTSGRLGCLDASECLPTFGVSKDTVFGIIAGGKDALTDAVEGAEDDEDAAVRDLTHVNLNRKDVLVCIAASGRTPYTVNAAKYARSVSAKSIGVVSCKNSILAAYTDVCIAPITGPECITGSTRMKSGTAQKMVLNMLSTASMVKLGKVYQNLMVDVQATNEKLVSRAINIVKEATGADEKTCKQALQGAGFSCKKAIVMILLQVSKEDAEQLLSAAEGHISTLLKQNNNTVI